MVKMYGCTINICIVQSSALSLWDIKWNNLKFKQYIKQDIYEAVLTENGDIYERFYKVVEGLNDENWRPKEWSPWTLKVIELGK